MHPANPHAPFSSESPLSKVFQDAPILFAISTVPEGRYLDVNDNFLKTLGFCREEVIGNTSIAMELWHNPSERTRLVSHIREHGFFQNEEVTIRKKNGDCFTGLFSGMLFDFGAEPLLFTLASDISVKKEAENKLSQASRLLEEAVKQHKRVIVGELQERQRVLDELRAAKQMLIDRNREHLLGNMIGSIVHQWRQPLNVLGLFIQKFSQESLDGARISETDLQKAMDLIVYISETAETFRSFLAPDGTKGEFSLNEAIARTLFLFETMHGRESIGLDYIKPTVVIMTFGNSKEFCQALLNILTNARDALVENRVPLPRIVLDVSVADGQASISISDNGGGIKEDGPPIFDPCFTTKSQENGSGVGLFITRSIIEERMGGKVSACNRDEGARFTICIPCISQEEAVALRRP